MLLNKKKMWLIKVTENTGKFIYISLYVIKSKNMFYMIKTKYFL